MGKTKAHPKYRLKPTDLFPKGEIVPGVTTIIDGQLGWNKRALMAWQRREALAGQDPDKIRDEAADSGTCTHYLVECHIKDIEPDLKDFTQNQIEKGETGFLAFLEWEKDNALEYVHIELPVVSERFRYGGIVDMIARKNSQLWLLDIKTSKAVYHEHKIQVAAYRTAYEEQSEESIRQCHIIQLSKDTGGFQHHTLSDDELLNGWKAFDHCRSLYDIQKNF